jgi:DNA sulfur modification protein DndD
MLIRRLILENYGLFAGRHELDLVPRVQDGKQRSIILFGGKNGAGKTTILEAIRLVLYGRLSLGSRVRAIDYDSFLRGRVHRARASLVKPTVATLAIEFDHVHRGTNERYFVERSWHTTGAAIVEQLSVLRDGNRLEEIDAEFWQGFVRDIIPEGLSQLFFFDGEKIKELAEDATGAGVLADSIKSLLGLDLVERLDADLTVYANREVAKLGSEEDRSKAAQLDGEIVSLRAAIATCEEELASNRTRQDGVQAEVRRAEEDLRREGENLASRRSRLQSDKVEWATRIEQVEKELRDECDALFPMSLCAKLASRLTKQLDAERSSAHAGHVRSALEKTQGELVRALRALNGSTPRNLKNVQSAVEAVFAKRLKAVAARPKPGAGHQLSEVDQRRIVACLADAKAKSQIAVAALCAELGKLKQKQDATDRALAQIPADATVRPRIEALTELSRRLGALEQSRAETEERLRGLQFQLDSKERERNKAAERHQGVLDVGSRVKLARSVQDALGDYLKRLTRLKVAQLRETVAACFNRLCRKGDVVTQIEIDASTFAVTLFDRQGHAVPKEELSSGEKQIFAIAMLWGLAQTSGRPLPVIIDTPLGRLDSDHRRNLIEQYFPHASHQVILLSTDTEVDQALFDELRPSVSHAFHLHYHDNESRTEVTDGYFWQRTVCA